MELNDKVSAVVTGGASGLGEATARELAAQGVKVALFDLNAERGEAVAAEIGGVFCECDVTSEEAVDRAFKKARGAQGQERVLVNCAGGGIAMKTVSKGRYHPVDAFDKVVQLNLVGTFRCIGRSAAGMSTLDPLNEDGERGCIVNTASIAGYEGQIGQVAYAAAKGGIIGMTLTVARDLGDIGVRNNTIAPGVFDTPAFGGASEEMRAHFTKIMPFPRRFGKPEEFARLARHLCENTAINGQIVRIDSGIRFGPR